MRRTNLCYDFFFNAHFCSLENSTTPCHRRSYDAVFLLFSNDSDELQRPIMVLLSPLVPIRRRAPQDLLALRAARLTFLPIKLFCSQSMRSSFLAGGAKRQVGWERTVWELVVVFGSCSHGSGTSME